MRHDGALPGEDAADPRCGPDPFGDRAYKLKKPVDLGFLDFRRRADRFRACHREVRLNRRLAPDVYLGVADIVGPDGLPGDHMVVMRRMPDERRLSTLVRRGAPVDAELRRLARVMAVFHGIARRGPAIDAEGGRAGLRGRWDATFEQLRHLHSGVLDRDAADEVERRAHESLDGRDRLFTDRIAHGRIVDGHGDLLADDIFLLDDGPRILDCLEFDDRLRYLDGLDDAAFLAMDLEHLGAPALAGRFLDWYAQFSDDPAPEPLRHHYVAYRAFVRAKVACLRHEQGNPNAAADVVAYTDLTLRHLRAGMVRLIAVGGPRTEAKTSLAGRLADQLGATVLSSDRIRREMAGLDPRMSAAAGFDQGIYTTEWTDRTYAELCWRARQLLEVGQTVILDASFTRDRHREAARRLAACTHSTLTELLCTAGITTLAAPSDADSLIAGLLAAGADDWPQARHVATDPGAGDVAPRSPPSTTTGRRWPPAGDRSKRPSALRFVPVRHQQDRAVCVMQCGHRHTAQHDFAERRSADRTDHDQRGVLGPGLSGQGQRDRPTVLGRQANPRHRRQAQRGCRERLVAVVDEHRPDRPVGKQPLSRLQRCRRTGRAVPANHDRSLVQGGTLAVE
ncbi:hypothetical protein FHR83_009244 [Actinoplanes campanulatus]|uniref:AAA domain-containing protein n=1 Tax=Actinoplanes campanulatus TaxID=113559 RepID=A0A7W5FKF0_9ACTN|nr:hypothetical protein [Actinoplanes campanulatus]GGN52035.1 hypothetical protein GCM10010109_92700 [Actinoplanes campanulatus]GID36311.1 hypothetical protein Aca09nite_28170 [Actinoplanes campanulatus]